MKGVPAQGGGFTQGHLNSPVVLRIYAWVIGKSEHCSDSMSATARLAGEVGMALTRGNAEVE